MVGLRGGLGEVSGRSRGGLGEVSGRSHFFLEIKISLGYILKMKRISRCGIGLLSFWVGAQRRGLVAVALGGAVFAGSCAAPGSGGDEEGGVRYEVVATVGMLADPLREILSGVEGVVVTQLIGEGVDPHGHTPTRQDVIALQRANLVFYNGLLLEGRMGDVLARTGGGSRPTYAVAEEVVGRGGWRGAERFREGDPHLWMDVSAWVVAVDVLADVLAGFDPDHEETIRGNAREYQEGLSDLDAYARTAVGSIPEAQRVLITAHDAFHYFGAAYGLEVHGIQGVSTESESGLRDLEALVSMVVERRIPAVFPETSVSDRSVRALQEGARARGHEVVIGGRLFSDSMGQPGTYSGTYVGMIDHNVTIIARALGGDVPERGFQGRLEP